MKLIEENSVTTATLEAGEELERHVLQAAIQHAEDNGNWSVFLLLLPETATAHRDMLMDLEFFVAGTFSTATQHLLKLKRAIRTSGEAGGSTLAVDLRTLEPTPLEQAAIALMLERYGKRI
jgi:hypothetical protein